MDCPGSPFLSVYAKLQNGLLKQSIFIYEYTFSFSRHI